MPRHISRRSFLKSAAVAGGAVGAAAALLPGRLWAKSPSKPPNSVLLFADHEGYLTDVLGDEACRFIRENKARPFFAYVSFNAVHNIQGNVPIDNVLAMFRAIKDSR